MLKALSASFSSRRAAWECGKVPSKVVPGGSAAWVGCASATSSRKCPSHRGQNVLHRHVLFRSRTTGPPTANRNTEFQGAGCDGSRYSAHKGQEHPLRRSREPGETASRKSIVRKGKAWPRSSAATAAIVSILLEALPIAKRDCILI